MRRRLWLYGGTAVAAAVILTVKFAEGALRIPQAYRTAAEDRLAYSVKSASWCALETRATDGATLKAWLFKPREPNGSAAILLHGVGDTRRGMISHARYLTAAGYACLLPDSRGHGESGGEIVTYGVLEAGDVARWADVLAREIHPRALVALGESMGAAVLLQALPGEPRIRAAVAECPFDEFREIAVERAGQFTGVAAPWLFRPVVEGGLLYTRMKYRVALEDASPASAMRRTRTPVLLIHGTADDNIPAAHSRRLAQARPESTVLWEVQGAHHVDALGTDQEGFKQRVLAWFGTMASAGDKR